MNFCGNVLRKCREPWNHSSLYWSHRITWTQESKLIYRWQCPASHSSTYLDFMRLHQHCLRAAPIHWFILKLVAETLAGSTVSGVIFPSFAEHTSTQNHRRRTWNISRKDATQQQLSRQNSSFHLNKFSWIAKYILKHFCRLVTFMYILASAYPNLKII